MRTGSTGSRGWLLRLVIAFGCVQGAVSTARPAVSYRALALRADERAVGVITAGYALLPLFAAVPLGRRTDHGRCAPLLAAGVALIAGGCALGGLAGSLWATALWSGVTGLGHLCFVIGAQSLVARRSAPHEQDRNFGHFTIGAALGQLVGPVAAGALVGGPDMARGSALALLTAGAGAAVAFTSLWRLEDRTAVAPHPRRGARVPVTGILRARGVPAGMLISLSVLSATDILTAYLPVVGEDRGIAPSTVGVLLGLRAGATLACRLVLTPLLRLLGRPLLLTVSCLLAALLCAGVALPVPVGALGAMLAVLGFCLGVGQPLSMTTVVRAAPAGARSTALALRLTGNRLGQVAAPAAAGLVAGLAGVAAPFVMLGALLLLSSGVALRSPDRPEEEPDRPGEEPEGPAGEPEGPREPPDRREGSPGRVHEARPERPGLRRTGDF
ncbi:MFS transporter [Streptomyces sp. NPDC100445]|uniref:MFS transporter n=1 Tax=Streptomyces sp. NPDC100445 TaxID=3366102 RepID=UPI00380DA62F